MADPGVVNAAEVSLLYRISSVVSSALSVDEILNTLIRLAVETTGCDACLVYLPDPAGGGLVLRASQPAHSTEIGTLRLKPGEGVAGWVHDHRSVVALARDAHRDARFKRFPALAEDTYEALLSAPLMSAGSVIGVINIHHRGPHQHTPGEIALILFLGEQMGGAIARRRLEEQKLAAERQLETRKLLERAKGILQRTYGLTEEEAYLRIRNESRRSRRSMRDLAQAIIVADGVAREAEGAHNAE